MVRPVVEGSGEVLLCGTCLDTRGPGNDETLEGVRRSTMDEPAESHRRFVFCFAHVTNNVGQSVTHAADRWRRRRTSPA